jgi:hypothetical protein
VVKSNLAGIQNNEMETKRKSKRFIFKGKKFYLCTFEVRAIVAPADLRFELWFGGQKFSKNHDPIQVTWDSDGVKGETIPTNQELVQAWNAPINGVQ